MPSNQIFSKSVIMTISNFEARLSSSLNFYKEDNVMVTFYINQLNFETALVGTRMRTTSQTIPLTGASAKMIIQVPDDVPISVETTEIGTDSGINFRFTIPYVNYAGITKMQIVLTDAEGNVVHTPPVEVEIREPIGLLDDDDVAHTATVNANRYTRNVAESEFVLGSDGYYYVDIVHNIQGTDGNVFVTVVDGTTLEEFIHMKQVLTAQSFRLYLLESRSVKVSVRR